VTHGGSSELVTVECVYFCETEGVALAIPLYYNDVIDDSPLTRVEDGLVENGAKCSERTSQGLNVAHSSSVRNGVPEIEDGFRTPVDTRK
jgi:hypothetical protein